VSKYLLNKFLYTVDRDPELVERYRDEPRELVEWWESTMANKLLNSHSGEDTTWLRFDETERAALARIRSSRSRCSSRCSSGTTRSRWSTRRRSAPG
jgi:hypothetical protein